MINQTITGAGIKPWASSEIIPSVYKRSRLKGSIKSDNQFYAVFCKYTWAMMLIWSAYCLNMMDHGFDWIFPVTTWIELNWRKCILVHNFLLVWSSQSLLWKRLAWLPWADIIGRVGKSTIFWRKIRSIRSFKTNSGKGLLFYLEFISYL